MKVVDLREHLKNVHSITTKEMKGIKKDGLIKLCIEKHLKPANDAGGVTAATAGAVAGVFQFLSNVAGNGQTPGTLTKVASTTKKASPKRKASPAKSSNKKPKYVAKPGEERTQ